MSEWIVRVLLVGLLAVLLYGAGLALWEKTR